MAKEKKTIETLEKEELRELLEIHGGLWLTIDGLWIQAIEREYGTEKCRQIYTGIFGQYAIIEARRIMRFLGIQEGTATVDDYVAARGMISKAVKCEYDRISDKETIMSIINCRPQQARKEKGQPVFPCKSIEFADLVASLKQSNPKLKGECLFCPPDERPADLPERVSCRWKVTLEE